MKVKISDIFDFEKGTLQSSKCSVGEYDFITASSDWKKHNTYSHECEALIIAVAASGSLGRTHYVSGKFIASDLCFILQPKAKFKEKINLKFYFEYFNFIKNDLIQKTATGSAKKAINKFNFAKYEINFPNKEYQDRIVQRLYEFKNNFSKIEENLNYNTELTTKLRQSILQDAIQGKLVPQDPTDEPASELLKRIECCHREKPIKCNLNNELNVIPKGWIYTHLGNVVENFKYGTSEKSNYNNKGIPVIRIPNIVNNKISLKDLKYLETHNVLSNNKVKNGDILIIRSNGSKELVGKTALVEDLEQEYAFASYLIRLRPIMINCEFLIILLNSYIVKNQFMNLASTTVGINNINSEKLSKINIVLPPLKEQERIVKKVKELMQLCDKLENENANAQKFSSELLQSIMQKYFTPEV